MKRRFNLGRAIALFSGCVALPLGVACAWGVWQLWFHPADSQHRMSDAVLSVLIAAIALIALVWVGAALWSVLTDRQVEDIENDAD